MHGAVLGIRRAPVDGAYIEELHRALDADAGSEKRVLLIAYRLSPDFPIELENTTGAKQWVPLLRELERSIAAYAMITEFGGVRAASMRAITRLAWSLARPRIELGTFWRLTDAVSWVAPRAQRVGALDDPAQLVRLYRTADRMLAEIGAGSITR